MPYLPPEITEIILEYILGAKEIRNAHNDIVKYIGDPKNVMLCNEHIFGYSFYIMKRSTIAQYVTDAAQQHYQDGEHFIANSLMIVADHIKYNKEVRLITYCWVYDIYETETYNKWFSR